jgi:DUF971 family protein
MSASTVPKKIAVSKSRGLAIEWADGHASQYACAPLRDACPCATCTGAHGNEPQPSTYAAKPAEAFPLFKPRISIDRAEPVGSYAIRIDWNDGHNSGIYSFDYLRSICPCEACRAI